LSDLILESYDNKQHKHRKMKLDEQRDPQVSKTKPNWQSKAKLQMSNEIVST
jgi:hypothetical protein